MKNKVYIVGHSLSPQGDELITVLATFPRIILSEINTHRMLSKNTSSSRAIPFEKMVEAVQNDPFIPFAWQKYHPGMQGNDYLDETIKYDLISFIDILNDTLTNEKDEKKRKILKKRIEGKTKIIKEILTPYTLLEKTLPEWWLFARDKAVETASILYVFDVTKQLCNRLLEPFMWTTMLITGSKGGWNNFFKLRCPQYALDVRNKSRQFFKSKKDFANYVGKESDITKNGGTEEKAKEIFFKYNLKTDLDWLKCNLGQAEIHIMDLAEKIYDAVNESKPKQLKAGEWHIPFENKINIDGVQGVKFTLKDGSTKYVEAKWITEYKVKVSTAMAARTSYTVVGDEKGMDYQKMIDLHDRLVAQDPPHSSPMEHCCICVTKDEYNNSLKGQEKGWFRNYKGFKSYRQIIEDK